jgi:hypothetical protein
MKKKFTVIATAIVLVIVLGFAIAFLAFQGNFSINGNKNAKVSELKIDHSADWLNCYLYFAVTNLHNSPLTTIGSRVNGVNYGYSTLQTSLQVPPGQTQNESLLLQNLVITKTSNYEVELTFTFDDGQYQVYSQSISSEKYVGAAFITNESFIVWVNETVLSLTIQNTGNIPITNIQYTTENITSAFSMKSDLMPKNTGVFKSELFGYIYRIGDLFPVTFQVTYADQSTTSIKASILAVSS